MPPKIENSKKPRTFLWATVPGLTATVWSAQEIIGYSINRGFNKFIIL